MVLLTAEAAKLSKPFDAFLSFALANTKDTVRFVHVYSNRQQEFANTLVPDSDTFQGKSAVSHGFSSSKFLTSLWHLNAVSSFFGCFEYRFQEIQKSLSLF